MTAPGSKASGRIYERVFVRHWDSWADGTRSHLFATALGADGTALAAVDVSKGFDADIPGKPFGGAEDFDFSPDGKMLVFSARLAGHSEPWSTNFDLFQVSVAGGTPVNLTADNPAWDAQPVFLANGDLAWLAQQHPGYEADRFQVMLKSAKGGAVRALTKEWDRSVARLEVTADGKTLLASVDELGQHVLYRLDPKTGIATRLTAIGEIEDFNAGRDRVILARADLGAPTDLYSVSLRGGEPVRLTEVNRELLASRQLRRVRAVQFPGLER